MQTPLVWSYFVNQIQAYYLNVYNLLFWLLEFFLKQAFPGACLIAFHKKARTFYIHNSVCSKIKLSLSKIQVYFGRQPS